MICHCSVTFTRIISYARHRDRVNNETGTLPYYTLLVQKPVAVPKGRRHMHKACTKRRACLQRWIQGEENYLIYSFGVCCLQRCLHC